ncbi:hypothetical protein KJ969_01440 [Patescibacteria group bacterium]|nr:hypothetical protein [Patescibacteria group bacterium]MBU1922021.1 hypothetical protein [Patescibacteria group bacterium]
MPVPPESRNVRIFVKSVLRLGAIIGWVCLVLALLWHLGVLGTIAVVASVFGAILVIAGLIWHFSGREPNHDIDIDRFLKPENGTDSPKQNEPDCFEDPDDSSKKEASQSDNIIYH